MWHRHTNRVLLLVAITVAGCAPQQASDQPSNEPAELSDGSPPPQAEELEEVEAGSEQTTGGQITPWTDAKRNRLLTERIDGSMAGSFRRFSGMFLVNSRIELGVGVGLMTLDTEIMRRPLQSPFPSSYRPTLREFLDTIALQTFSQWQYDPSSKFFQSDQGGPVDDVVIFEFSPRPLQRHKPFEVTLATGWKAVDRGSWLMHIPPTFPMGMDVHEMGTYSCEDGADEDEFYREICRAVSMKWAQTANRDVEPNDLQATKVGGFDALYYKSMLPSKAGEPEIRWRQWAFMVDSKCYFIMSAIPLEQEAALVPDVEAMVASFRLRS